MKKFIKIVCIILAFATIFGIASSLLYVPADKPSDKPIKDTDGSSETVNQSNTKTTVNLYYVDIDVDGGLIPMDPELLETVEVYSDDPVSIKLSKTALVIGNKSISINSNITYPVLYENPGLSDPAYLTTYLSEKKLEPGKTYDFYLVNFYDWGINAERDDPIVVDNYIYFVDTDDYVALTFIHGDLFELVSVGTDINVIREVSTGKYLVDEKGNFITTQTSTEVDAYTTDAVPVYVIYIECYPYVIEEDLTWAEFIERHSGLYWSDTEGCVMIESEILGYDAPLGGSGDYNHPIIDTGTYYEAAP